MPATTSGFGRPHSSNALSPPVGPWQTISTCAPDDHAASKLIMAGGGPGTDATTMPSMPAGRDARRTRCLIAAAGSDKPAPRRISIQRCSSLASWAQRAGSHSEPATRSATVVKERPCSRSSCWTEHSWYARDAAQAASCREGGTGKTDGYSTGLRDVRREHHAASHWRRLAILGSRSPCTICSGVAMAGDNTPAPTLAAASASASRNRRPACWVGTITRTRRRSHGPLRT